MTDVLANVLARGGWALSRKRGVPRPADQAGHERMHLQFPACWDVITSGRRASGSWRLTAGSRASIEGHYLVLVIRASGVHSGRRTPVTSTGRPGEQGRSGGGQEKCVTGRGRTIPSRVMSTFSL